MSWHLRHDNLLCRLMPKIIYPQAPLWVSRIAAVLDVPVRSLPLSLPIQIELICSAVSVANSIFDNFFTKAAFTTLHATLAASSGEPQQTASRHRDIRKFGRAYLTARLRC